MIRVVNFFVNFCRGIYVGLKFIVVCLLISFLFTLPIFIMISLGFSNEIIFLVSLVWLILATIGLVYACFDELF